MWVKGSQAPPKGMEGQGVYKYDLKSKTIYTDDLKDGKSTLWGEGQEMIGQFWKFQTNDDLETF